MLWQERITARKFAIKILMAKAKENNGMTGNDVFELEKYKADIERFNRYIRVKVPHFNS